MGRGSIFLYKGRQALTDCVLRASDSASGTLDSVKWMVEDHPKLTAFIGGAVLLGAFIVGDQADNHIGAVEVNATCQKGEPAAANVGGGTVRLACIDNEGGFTGQPYLWGSSYVNGGIRALPEDYPKPSSENSMRVGFKTWNPLVKSVGSDGLGPNVVVGASDGNKITNSVEEVVIKPWG